MLGFPKMPLKTQRFILGFEEALEVRGGYQGLGFRMWI